MFDHLNLDPSNKSITPPNVDGGLYLVGGEVKRWSGPCETVLSPIFYKGNAKAIPLGTMAELGEHEALEAVAAAAKAYDSGKGYWPCLSPEKRIEYVVNFIKALKEKKGEIANLLMWEIGKNEEAATKEVDRTIKYLYDTITALKEIENKSALFQSDEGVIAQVRRAPLGVVLCLGPFNYPFNETYTTLFPALIMGNTVVMKLPKLGCLSHVPTLELFQKIFPPGVINVISGNGRTILPPIMRSGKVDIFAFIGTSKAADALQKEHPCPHRLRICLGLDAKNPAIVLPDADLEVAVEECLAGSLSYNGQRCTALKILFVHTSIADKFVAEFCKKVDALKMGLPWEKGASITPLPEVSKPAYLQSIIADAVAKGAKIANGRGNQFDKQWVSPTVLYPVQKSMRVYHEEQFGPLVPIVAFEKIDEVYQYITESAFGQQASIFGNSAKDIGPLIDVLVNQVSRVNLNSQCQRGPDSYPFTGRKDSAYGTLSISDALRVFSIRSLVASKSSRKNQELINQILSHRSSNFLRYDYLF